MDERVNKLEEDVEYWRNAYVRIIGDLLEMRKAAEEWRLCCHKAEQDLRQASEYIENLERQLLKEQK